MPRCFVLILVTYNWPAGLMSWWAAGNTKTGGQGTGDAAGQPVAFFVAAHVREDCLMLDLRQSALKTGVLPPATAFGHAVAIFAGSSP